MSTAISIAKTEGVRVFGKGLVTALACNWPRSTFAMFATNTLREIFYEVGRVKEEKAAARPSS